MDHEARQADKWTKFYEQSWQLRATKIKDFVSQQNLSTLQALEKLERFELHHSATTYDHHAVFEPLTYDIPEEIKLPTGAPPFKRIELLESNLVAPFYSTPIDFVMDWLDQNPVSAVIELGAGFGQNLIRIFHRYGQKNFRIYAAEFTSSGRDLAQYLFDQTPGLDGEVHPFDHKRPRLDFVKERDNVLILSIHSIEQVTSLPVDYFELLLKDFTNVHGMFFEPFGFQITKGTVPYGDVSRAHEAAAKEREWNQNLFSVVQGAESRGAITVRSLSKNIMPGDSQNPTSFVYWKGGRTS